MQKTRTLAASGIFSCLFIVSCLSLTGCEQSEQITTYTTPKHKTLQTKRFLAEQDRLHPKPNRMIAVVIPQTELLWFFKLEGDIEAVAVREKDVRDFLNSVRFPSSSQIDWTLPAGWQRLPGTEMRFATLVLDGPSGLEISVTRFPNRPDSSPVEQVVLNINRWRNQLSLPAIDDEDLAAHSEKLDMNGSVGYLINIVGRPKPRPGNMAMPKPKPANAGEADRTEPKGPTFEKPKEWSEGTPNGFAVISLQAMEGDLKVAITVTAARGDTLDNVNRWRNQVQLEGITSEQLEKSAKPVEVGSLPGELYEMSNGDTTIFGVIVEDHGTTWFVKLIGNSGLAERERARFQTFLKSLRFG